MPDIKPIHALIGILILVATTTAGFVLWFTPLSYAEETRQLVMQFDEKQQLKWMQSELNEFDWNCRDKLTDEWVCSEKKKVKYDELFLEINLIRVNLGLKPLEE